MERISKLQHKIQQWSDEQFGNDRTALPIAYHLKKEVDELIEALKLYYAVMDNPNATSEEHIERVKHIKEEFADCLMLLIDSAAHIPLTMAVLLKATENKLKINKNRKWGSPDENGVVEHVRGLSDNGKKCDTCEYKCNSFWNEPCSSCKLGSNYEEYDDNGL